MEKTQRKAKLTTKVGKKSAKSADTNLDRAIEALNAKPSAENWKNALGAIKKSKAKYYRIFYEKGLKNTDNLKNAYAIIYDASYKRLFRIPVIEMEGKGIKGATKYLTGLKINNKQRDAAHPLLYLFFYSYVFYLTRFLFRDQIVPYY